jgi:hypothetical protein
MNQKNQTKDMAEDTNDAGENDAKTPDDGRIRKKEVYDHVAVATGLRKRDVREAIDSTLAYFHQCLSEGKDLHLPPLGKIRVMKRGKGEVSKLNYKLLLQSATSGKKDDEQSKEELAASDDEE